MWIFSSLISLALACAPALADGPDSTVNPDGIARPELRPAVAPPPPPFFVPVVDPFTCAIVLPVTTGLNLIPAGSSPLCAFTARCSGATCLGGNAITGWAIASQSCAGCFSIGSTGVLQGGANAASVAAGTTYTVTVTATNAGGTSGPVTQTINVMPTTVLPTVVSNPCTITALPTNGAGLTPACSYTALCGGLACAGATAITGWAVTAQSCLGCFALTSAGVVQGGANAGTVVAGSTYTLTVTASNAAGASAPVVQSIITPSGIGNCISWSTSQCLTWNGVGNAITYQ